MTIMKQLIESMISDYLEESNTIEQLIAHVKGLSSKLKLKGPIKTDRASKRLIYTTELSPQQVFDVLISSGYRKGGGYDPNPQTWDKSTDHESMRTRSDRIFFGKGGSMFMVNFEVEHGSKLNVIFQAQ